MKKIRVLFFPLIVTELLLRQPLKFDAAFDFYYFLKFGKKKFKDVDFFITNLRQTNGLFEG